MSSGLTQAETIRSAKNRTEGEARILESEIHMDKGRCGDSESIARREEKLAKLQQRAGGLNADIMKLAGDTADKIREIQKAAEEKTPEEPSPEQETKDSLTDMPN